MSKQGDLHLKFQRVYRDAHPELSGSEAQRKANEIWKECKSNSNSFDDLQTTINRKINDCEALKLRKRSGYNLFFSKAATQLHVARSTPAPQVAIAPDINNSSVEIGESSNALPDQNLSSDSQSKHTPAQDRIAEQLSTLRAQKDALVTARDAGLDDDDRKIKKLKAEIKLKEQTLKQVKKNAQYQTKFRNKRNDAIKKLASLNTDNARTLAVHEQPGRPRFEHEDKLLEAIVDLVVLKSAADERRRTEMIRTYRTLDELHGAVFEQGFDISRSGLYLRLLPRNSTSIEGKKHITTVPVKLCKPQTDEHKKHSDGIFCTATIRNVEALASFLGPEQVIFISQDDKAKVPIGLTAAHKQAPMMMHLEYRVTLPDHDWVVAPKHKLTPSVYGAMVIKPQGLGAPDAVTYSGPTYVALRSLKHSPSNANTHAEDLKALLDKPSFKPFVKTADGQIKPVLIFSVDGGPDENPRYPKVIAFAIRHFLEYDLDAVFVVTNAPGRSAFNRIERRMAPLSAQLAGVILPAETYGTHLDGQGRTMDSDLELRNFTAAGEVLANVWSGLIIDGHAVEAEFKHPGNHPELPQLPDPVWYSAHVRESQYALQVVKCRNESCCKAVRSNVFNILPERFLPPPCPIRQTPTGLLVPAPSDVKNNDQFLPLFQRLALQISVPIPQGMQKMPYDMYCPSIANDLAGRVCPECGLYFASKKAVDGHSRAIHAKRRNTNTKVKPSRVFAKRGKELLCVIHDKETGSEDVEWIEAEEVDMNGVSEHIPTTDCNTKAEIRSVRDWATNEFTVDD